SKNAEITTDQNIAALFEQKITEGLEARGFKIVASRYQASATLKVEVRQIDYTTDMDFWKGTVLAKAALHASSRKDSFRFEQLYLGERKRNTIEGPTAKSNEQLINGAISEAVENLINDDRLTTFLAN